MQSTPSERTEPQPGARFIERARCISCESPAVSRVAAGTYREAPLRQLILDDPWGECPLPFLEDARWELVECRGCRTVFHRWVLAAEWQDVKFERWMGADAIRSFEARAGARSSARAFEEGRRWTEHVLRIERLTRPIREGPCRVLDFGCGWGSFLAVAKTFGLDAHGVDRDAHRLASARGVQVAADLDALPPEPFHAITLFEVLEHLEEPMALLRALRKRIVTGGILVAETPDCSGVSGIRTVDEFRAVHPLDHVNAFTPASLRKFVERAGFQVIASPVSVVANAPWELARALGRQVKRGLRRTTQLYAVAVDARG